MKEQQDYIQDIAEVRSMMERSSKFLSLSGLSGVLAGIYALAGAFIAYQVFDFSPHSVDNPTAATVDTYTDLLKVVFLALVVLLMALGTTILLSYNKAVKSREKFWNATTRRVMTGMAIPLLTGFFLILILIDKGLLGLIAPFTLLFYGLALFTVSKFTYEEIRSLGLIQIVLGLVSAHLVNYSLVCWALGFGIAHIVYGIYMHYKYER